MCDKAAVDFVGGTLKAEGMKDSAVPGNVNGSFRQDGEAAGEKSACDFCGSRDFESLFAGHDYLAFSPAGFNVVRCRRCRSVCLNPRPADIL